MKNRKAVLIGLSLFVILMLFGAGLFAAGILLGRYSARRTPATSPTPLSSTSSTPTHNQDLNEQLMDEVLGILNKEFYHNIHSYLYTKQKVSKTEMYLVSF